VLLAVILGLVMGGRLSAPITDLTETTRKMSAGDLGVRARVKGKDEIGELAAQFNHMAGQLQASFAQVAAERDTLRRFITDASHELRTPITALKNFNELLQEAAAEDPEARAEFLSESQAQLDRLAWITQNLLDLSRLDAGLAPLEIAAHDAGEIIASALAPFKARARDKFITLETSLPETPSELRCDRARLELALSNLLDNAIKFTPQGGQVLVSVEEAGQGVHIRVEDNGAGIHPDDLPHVFERFYRGRGATQEGSGLGLSIAHSVVQAHNGQIHVESEPGEGARFEIILPGEAQA
jgi:signal transduction histidine kinase